MAFSTIELGIDIGLTLLSRSPAPAVDSIRTINPDLDVAFVPADVTSALPSIEPHDLVFHAATTASAVLNQSDPDLMRSTIVMGMRHLLDVTAMWGQTRIIFTSSGAVYGTQPPNETHLSETYSPPSQGVGDAYAEGKRAAESSLRNWVDEQHSAVAARLFAFLGPGLPLDSHFAAGNFIRDAVRGGPIRISGDGRTLRSYQYPTDMCSWLLALAARKNIDFTYNVGSPAAITLADLAQRISDASGTHPRIEILGEPRPVHRYVPSTTKIVSELGVRNLVDLDEAIVRTLRWAQM